MLITKIPLDEVLALRQKVLWPNKNLEFVKTPLDPIGLHFGIKQSHTWVSCISLFLDTNHEAHFRKFATLAEHQNKGFGTQLLLFCFEYLRKKSIQTVYCDARIEKIDFYRKLGMIPTGLAFEKNLKTYQKMKMDLFILAETNPSI